MEPVYAEYLRHLEELSGLLERMSQTARNKLMAAREGDLTALDECMKQEQAYSMSLRGMDQKRDKMLAAMGLTGVTLSALADHYPEELQMQASKAAEQAMNRYEEYLSAADAARTTMECALRDIDRMMPENQRAQLEAEEPAPPPRMRTDFRA